MTTALLIIDVQEAMFAYPGMEPYDKEGVIGRIQSLLTKARTSGTPVIYIQHTEDGDSEFAKGTPTWEINHLIAPQEGETVIEKSVCDSFHHTTLDEELKRRGITELVICGMQSDYCVDTTTRRAFTMGYRPILVADAHSTFDNGILSAGDIVKHHNLVLEGSFAVLKPESEVEFA
ncbi:cysteine hydrolase family protein [Paenibacillus sp. NFR01]|uniref:cysteine hydrolase family protein n=1 Tax=Paenibacillus sp. NFR01 TaxID=1566279 RepID=UPI0008C26D7B|nr:cysteine hydrolase family protein [Paenibacillus sp. NFR01]SET29284.1 Nicotinamidase-related amidase [Paenibacillus sp. NFR01]